MKDAKTRTAMRDAERDRRRIERERDAAVARFLVADSVPVPRQRLRKVARAKRA